MLRPQQVPKCGLPLLKANYRSKQSAQNCKLKLLRLFPKRWRSVFSLKIQSKILETLFCLIFILFYQHNFYLCTFYLHINYLYTFYLYTFYLCTFYLCTFYLCTFYPHPINRAAGSYTSCYVVLVPCHLISKTQFCQVKEEQQKSLTF